MLAPSLSSSRDSGRKKKRLSIGKMTTFAIVVVALQTGCSGTSESVGPTPRPSANASATEPSSTATAISSATPKTREAPAAIGVPVVDKTVQAFYARDVDALLALMEFRPVPCEKNAQGTGAVLGCAPGEAAGTVHEVILEGPCQTFFVERIGARSAMSIRVGENLHLYLVALDGEEYQVVFVRPRERTIYLALLMSSSSIHSYGGACGNDALTWLRPSAKIIAGPYK